ncbi:amidase domain-containing protein [Paenibacillus tarimensis]
MPRSKPKTSQPRPQGLQGWKAAIHEYVMLTNQSELEYRSSHFAPLVTDEDHLARLEGKLVRIREREQSRQASAVKNESKAELVRVHEAGRETSVLLRIRLKKTVQQQGSVYVEDRCEYERVWVQDQGGRWRIVRVEPVVAERRPRFVSSQSGQDEQYLESGYGAGPFPKQQSAPYLNYDILTDFKHHRAGITYRRDMVAAYADLWWDKPNPAYEEFEVNCTNYVSQCLFAGNAPMNYTGRRDSGWWYKGRDKGRELWSFSWAVSAALQSLLNKPKNQGLRARQVQSAGELSLGDVIVYDWNGDGRYQHSTIVTAFDTLGMPLVNANTVSSRHRYWDYRDSYAWTERTRYGLFHIVDEL